MPESATLEHSEESAIADLERKLESMRSLLALPTPGSLEEWNNYMARLKSAMGNLNNDASFIVCLLAKRYLMAHHHIHRYDAALKPQGAPGLDIDVTTVEGERIVGEVKTTEPYGEHDFGSAQRSAIRNDLRKLQAESAAHKYLFVSSQRTYDIITRKYASMTAGIHVVMLGDPPADA
jgi:hypothetical protein